MNAGFPFPKDSAYPINLITCYSSKHKQTFTWGLQPYTGNAETVVNYRYFKSEFELLKDWLIWFHNEHFDLWSGWNSELFDVPYIVNRIKTVRQSLCIDKEIENALSPIKRQPIYRDVIDVQSKSVKGFTYDIVGLVHQDYMNLYEKFANHPPLSALSLNYITNLELNEGKLEYEGTINTIYKTDWNKFVEYNIQDVLLLVKLENKIKLFPMLIEYAYDCVCCLDKIDKTIPTTEGYLIRFLHNNNKVINDKIEQTNDWWKDEKCYIVKKDGKDYYQNCEWENNKFEFLDFANKAGYCYDYAGRFDNCMSFDITSSYPHHIMQFNISPEILVKHPTKEQIDSGEVILSDVNEIGFKRTDDAILPSFMRKVFAERKYWKDKKKEAHKEHNKELEDIAETRQLVKKRIINSAYGTFLCPSFHLYSIDVGRAITRCARVTLRDWLTKNVNDFYVSKYFIKDLEKEFGIKFKNDNPLVIKNRDVCAIHNDTDSVYLCFNEAIERLKEENVKFNTEEEKRDVYAKIENVYQTFFNKILELRAKATKTENKIKFNRENIFTNMFCFAKKLYIGSVIDSEGDKYPFDNPKHKIMGVPLKRSDMPDFCKVAAEKLAFDIASGQDYKTSYDFILETFNKFKNTPLEDICGRKSIKNYDKYVTQPTSHFVMNGFDYDKLGGIFQSKVALAYNYTIAKYNLPYQPIINGTKFNYLFIKPNNRNNIKAIAFLGKWPKEFSKLYEIDYETMFDKAFLPVFKNMFKIQKWIGEKETIKLVKDNSLDDFFV